MRAECMRAGANRGSYEGLDKARQDAPARAQATLLRAEVGAGEGDTAAFSCGPDSTLSSSEQTFTEPVTQPPQSP